MISFLKLIRIPNLILIVLLQLFIRNYLLLPMLGSYGISSSISSIQFYLLVSATVLIAAAGYIINDYFDLRMDYFNKPTQVIIGKSIKRRVAMMLHIIFSGIAVLICFYLAFKMQVWVIAIIPILTVGLLWFYSTDYKRQFLIGNIVISILSVFPILFVLLYEASIFRAFFSIENKEIAVLIFKVVGYYSAIVFLISLLGSIIKDIHDLEGDQAIKCKTIPIVLGTGISKLIVSLLIGLVLFALFYIQNLQFTNQAFVPLTYILLTIELPLLIGFATLILSNNSYAIQWSYRLVSAAMLFGVFAIPVLYYFPGK